MSDQADSATFLDYVRPIIRRLLMIVGIVVGITAFTYAYSSREPNVYDASTALLLSASADGADTSASLLTDRTVGNQVELITSQQVQRMVAARLQRQRQTSVVGSISAAPQSGRDIIVITAHAPSANSASILANAYAATFADLQQSQDRARNSKVLNETRRQLAEIPDTLSNATQRSQLEAQIQQLQISLVAGTGSVRQVNPAEPPAAPASPRPLRDAAIAFAVSLLGCVALAYVLDVFDRRLSRVGDIADQYKLPVMAMLPSTPDLTMFDNGRAAVPEHFKEALRQLRSNIQLSSDQVPQRILVTSALAGEGKSTVASALAISLREANLRVALIDADLRKPTLGKLYAGEVQVGLTDVLIGSHAIEDAVRRLPVEARGLQTAIRVESSPTSVHAALGTEFEPVVADEEITLLPAGQHLADPQTVLASPRLRAIVDALVETHDVVVIDSAPLLNVADSVSMASWVDAIVLVARIGRITRENVARLSETLERVPDANPLGVVVNDVPAREGYGYGYGYGYGSTS